MVYLSFSGAPHGGRLRLLPEHNSQPRITPTTIIDHSIVGSAEGAFAMFRDTSVLESHFIVGLTGEIWQLMDTDRQADANLRANDYALSIETADLGNPDAQPWTSPQLDALKWLHERLIQTHPTIPRRPSRSCIDPGGLGYHTMHGAPSCWTPVSKTCPGAVRIRQWREVLLPAFLIGSTAPQEVDVSWNDWTAEEKAALVDAVADEVNSRLVATLRAGFGGLHPDAAGPQVRPSQDWLFEQVAVTATAVEAIAAALPDPLSEPPPAS